MSFEHQRCPNCGSSNTSFLGKKRDYLIFACDTCEHRWSEES